MKKHVLIMFSLLNTICITAQEVVSTQGNSYSNSSGSIDFTIGEVMINTGTDENTSITQGFHQTYGDFIGVDNHNSPYEIMIFPNPTKETLNVKSDTYEHVDYTLYDTFGKRIRHGKLTGEYTPIDVYDLAKGNYYLRLDNGFQHVETFKFIKIH